MKNLVRRRRVIYEINLNDEIFTSTSSFHSFQEEESMKIYDFCCDIRQNFLELAECFLFFSLSKQIFPIKETRVTKIESIYNSISVKLGE